MNCCPPTLARALHHLHRAGHTLHHHAHTATHAALAIVCMACPGAPPAVSAPPPAIVACCMVPTPWTPLAGSLTPPLAWPSPWGWAPTSSELPNLSTKRAGSVTPKPEDVTPIGQDVTPLIVPDSPDDTAMPEPWPVFVVGFGLFGLGVVRMGWVRGPKWVWRRVGARVV